jgi:hypothetical protein
MITYTVKVQIWLLYPTAQLQGQYVEVWVTGIRAGLPVAFLTFRGSLYPIGFILILTDILGPMYVYAL